MFSTNFPFTCGFKSFLGMLPGYRIIEKNVHFITRTLHLQYKNNAHENTYKCTSDTVTIKYEIMYGINQIQWINMSVSFLISQKTLDNVF